MKYGAISLEAEEIETLAAQTVIDVGLDPINPNTTMRIARLHPLVREVLDLDELGDRSRAVANDDGTHTIEIGTLVPDRVYRLKVGHELGEILIPTAPHVTLHASERVCDCFSYAVNVTRPALEHWHAIYEFNIRRLAAVFGVSQIILALRFGDIGLYPMALVGVEAIWRRDPRGHLPGNATLTKMVLRHRAKTPDPKGYVVVKLTDVDFVWAVFRTS